MPPHPFTLLLALYIFVSIPAVAWLLTTRRR